MALNNRSNTEHATSPPVIVLTGGGSGGHITPLLAVAEEVRKLKPDSKVIFIGQKNDKLFDVPAKHSSIDSVYAVRAGKFRRFHGEGFKQILNISTLLKNIRDFFYVLIGVWQSFWLLKRIRPSIIFVRGSYVGVPVCLAAALRRIPYVTHDSDAVPSLTTKVVGRWATAYTVALPKNVYKYPASRTHSVGVPISGKFNIVNDAAQRKYKKALKIKATDKLVFITGGGLGAKRLNEVVIDAVKILMPDTPNLHIIHAAGRLHEGHVSAVYKKTLDSSDNNRVTVKGYFVDDLWLQSGAADIVVTRAGATNIAEFAAQHKACIIVPNPQLTGAHQVKNAEYLSKQSAAVVLNDNQITANPQLLADSIKSLLNSPAKRQSLGSALGRFAKPRAAKELAELLLDTITDHQKY